MEVSIITQLATQFGAPGMFIGYLIWDKIRSSADRKAADDIKATFDQARLEADKAMSAALASLTTAIQSMQQHGRP